MIEAWIVDARREVCLACDRLDLCEAVPGLFFQVFSAEVSPCPKGQHLARADAIAARAWPESAPRRHGCCDRADQA